MDDAKIRRSRSFWYLGFVIQDGREFIEDVTNRIKAG